MRRLSIGPTLLLAAILALVGGMSYVQFYSWRGDQDPHFFALLALGISTAIGLLADHRKHATLIVLVAAISAVSACVVGNLQVALLQGAALSDEFDLASLDDPDFYVALEAYKKKYTGVSSAPPFMGTMDRSRYTDEEWAAAKERWNAMPAAEQESIRDEWRTNYERLNQMAADELTMVFTAPWNQIIYAIAGALSGGIVLLIQRAERSKLE